ncbi:MAG: hypothetical protein N3F67_01160 [Acidilobaceae archaeon]|nr:hypothetical protein [Acidilobaceae archaeon]
MVKGGLVKIREEVGEGVLSFSFSSPELVMGEGANAVKRASLRLPPARPRNAAVRFSYLTVAVLAPPHLKAPLRWRMELEGVTVAREFKPQVVMDLEEGRLMGALYDTSPILSAKKNALQGCTLRLSYDSTHPITVVEASMVNAFSLRKARYSLAYFSGFLGLEPGDKVRFPLSLPAEVGKETSVVAAALVRSPRAVLRISAGERAEVSGPGMRVVELAAKGAKEVEIEYPAQEVKIYPKKVVVTALLFVNRALPAPLELALLDLKKEGSSRTIELLVRNSGNEAAEDVSIAVKQSTIYVKEVRLDPIGPHESVKVSLSLDITRLPSRSPRVAIEARWTKEGIPSSRVLEVEL